METIPTIDLSPFLEEGSDVFEGGKRSKAKLEEIKEACREYGFFQVVNHGLPLELMRQAMASSREFFASSTEEKLKYVPKSGAFPPAGYWKSHYSAEGKEHFAFSSSSLGFNECPPLFQQVLKEIFEYLTKLGMLIESIIGVILGLAPNFLKEYNNDRSYDFLMAHHYFPAKESENIEKYAHEDGNIVTFVFQDEVGGLEVHNNGQWIPILPSEGNLVVNIGDTIRVMSNDKLKSGSHRVVRQIGKSRYSFAFFYNLDGDKWVEPLPQLTTDIGESPKFRGFLFKEYLELRIKTECIDRPNLKILST